MGTKYYFVWATKNPDFGGQGFKGSQGDQPAVKSYLHNGQQIPICGPPIRTKTQLGPGPTGRTYNRTVYLDKIKRMLFSWGTKRGRGLSTGGAALVGGGGCPLSDHREFWHGICGKY